MIGGFIAGALGSSVLSLLMIGIAHAATVSAVSDLYLGRQASIRSAYASAKGSILIVIAILILSGLATVVGLIFLIVPGIYLACRLGVSVPVAIVEKESPIASMERSVELTRGYGWQIFLLFLLVFVLAYVVAILLQFPVLYFTFSATLAKHQIPLGVTAYSYIAQYVSQVIVGPIGTISACLMYYNLRVRKKDSTSST